MKLKVLKPFINKENKKQIFEAGAIIDIDDVARINDIVKRGLGEVIEQPTGADIDNETPAPSTVADEKKGEKPADGEKPKAGRSSRKPKKEDKEVAEQPEEGDATPATEEVAEPEGAETKEE